MKKYIKISVISIIFLLSLLFCTMSANADVYNPTLSEGSTTGWNLNTGDEVFSPGYDDNYCFKMLGGNHYLNQSCDFTGHENITLWLKSGSAGNLVGYINIDMSAAYGDYQSFTVGAEWVKFTYVIPEKFRTGIHTIHLKCSNSAPNFVYIDQIKFENQENIVEKYKLKLTMVDAATGSLITNGYVYFQISDGTTSESYIPVPNTEFEFLKVKTVIATFTAPGYGSQIIGYSDNTTATINMHKDAVAGMVKLTFTSNLQKFDVQTLDENDTLRYYHSDIGYMEININPNQYYNYYAKSEYYTNKYYTLSGTVNTEVEKNIVLDFYQNTYEDVTATPIPGQDFEDNINNYPPPPSLPNNVFNPLEWLFYLAKLISWIAGFIWYVCVSFMRTLINYMSELVEFNSQIVEPLFLNNTTKYAFYGHFWDSINNSTMSSVNMAFEPILDVRDACIDMNDIVVEQQKAATNASKVYQVLFMPMLTGLPTSFKVYGIWKLTLLMLLQVMGK